LGCFSKDFNLPEKPEWLKVYESSNETAFTFVRKGYHCNAAGCSKLAIPFFPDAYEKEPQVENPGFGKSILKDAG